jgi:hypothetical protein
MSVILQLSHTLHYIEPCCKEIARRMSRLKGMKRGRREKGRLMKGLHVKSTGLLLPPNNRRTDLETSRHTQLVFLILVCHRARTLPRPPVEPAMLVVLGRYVATKAHPAPTAKVMDRVGFDRFNLR